MNTVLSVSPRHNCAAAGWNVPQRQPLLAWIRLHDCLELAAQSREKFQLVVAGVAVSALEWFRSGSKKESREFASDVAVFALELSRKDSLEQARE